MFRNETAATIKSRVLRTRLLEITRPHACIARVPHRIHVVASNLAHRPLNDIRMSSLSRGSRISNLRTGIGDIIIGLLTDPQQERHLKGRQIPVHCRVVTRGDALGRGTGVEIVAHDHGAAFIVGDGLAVGGGVVGGLGGSHVRVVGEGGGPGKGWKGEPFVAPVVGLGEDVLGAGAAGERGHGGGGPEGAGGYGGCCCGC